MSVSHNRFTDVIRYTSKELREVLSKVPPEKIADIEEIRIRANKPVIIQNYREDWFVDGKGCLTKNEKNAFVPGVDDIIKTLEIMSMNSIYVFQDDIRNGFITLPGGHRVGIAGKTVIENGKVINMKNISSLNIRISREVKGCSLKIIKYILGKRNEPLNTLIISPPQCGKTTMLRDITRNLSNGIKEMGFSGVKVGLIDERSEIAACYNGIPQFDVGIRTDVLDSCPKSIGMIMMVRSMSPQVIVTDEIGNQGDRDSIVSILNAGVKIIASAHGFNISELKSRHEILSLIENRLLDRYVVLSNVNGPGTIEEIIDGSNMEIIYKRNRM